YTSGSAPLAIETVTVPAGTFTNAVHVRLTINYSGVVNYSATLDDWLVAGVGSVREVSTDTTSSTTTTWELRSYAIRRPLADFSGDGHSDVLWRNTSTGENYIYLMNGLTVASQGSINAVSDQAWQVKGIGDFDGDGKADILWRNSSTGENYIWLMNGLSTASQGSVNFVDPASGWQVQGIGDFDGDGKADILCRNTSTGENYIYLMNGLTIARPGSINSLSDQAWLVQGDDDCVACAVDIGDAPFFRAACLAAGSGSALAAGAAQKVAATISASNRRLFMGPLQTHLAALHGVAAELAGCRGLDAEVPARRGGGSKRVGRR